MRSPRRVSRALALVIGLLLAMLTGGGTSLASPSTFEPHFVQANDYYPVGLGYYRGGSSLEPKPNEVKIRDGMVQSSHGLSINRNASKVEKFGGAYAVMSIPETLKIIQRGTRDPEHFEIVPAEPMSLEDYTNELRRVDLQLAQQVK